MSDKITLIIDAEDRTKGVLSGVSSAIANIGRVALVAAGAGVLAFGNFLKDSVIEAANSELAIADLNAVITSTGGIAGITSQAAQDLASSLQSVTRFSDETIMKAEGMLLTFTNIGKNVFPLATETVLNMAEKFGGADAAAIQLGKALNNPIEGITALKRVGVQFTDEQENLIKSLMAAGKLEDAQKIILGELQTEFGGVAVAAGNTAAGLKDRFTNALSDIQETIGKAILPSLVTLGDTLLTTFSDPRVQEFITVFAQKLADMSIITIDWILDLPNKIRDLGEAVAASPFGAFLDFMGLWWAANGESIKTTAESLFNSLQEAVGRAGDTLGPFVEDILSKLMLWFAENGPLITSTISVLGSAFAYLVDAIVIFWEAVQPVLSSFLTLLLSWGTFAMQVITGDFSGAWETFQQIVANAIGFVQTLLSNFFSLILQLLGSNVAEFTKIWSDNWNQLVEILGKVKDNIGAKFGEWHDVGVQLIQNMIEGVKSAVGGLISAAVGAVSGALGAASGALGLGGSSSGGNSGRGRPGFGFASGTGGIMQVPSGYENDTYPIRLTSGENFAVWGGNGGASAPGGAGGGNVINITYAPGMSFGDEANAQSNLYSVFLSLLEQAKANGHV